MKIEDILWDMDEGGRRILNIPRCNEAINLMWVKQYLNMGKEQPKWVCIVDEILQSRRPKQAKETHPEIENWNLSGRGHLLTLTVAALRYSLTPQTPEDKTTGKQMV